jgi:hypothetical protein
MAGWVLVAAMAFGIGFFAIVMEHFQKMAKIRGDQQVRGSREVMEAIDSLRREVAELRETTTKYDVSFDMALQRLENRVAHVESEQQSRLGASQ